MSRGTRTLQRLVAKVAVVTLAATLLAAVSGAARAVAVYDRQLSGPAGLFLVNAYWGGWKAYDAGGLGNSHLAFGVDLSGADDCAATNTCYRAVPAGDLLAYTAGLLGTGQTTAAVSPVQAYGASYVPGSNVLRLPDGRWRYLPEGAGRPVTVPAGDVGARAQYAARRRHLGGPHHTRRGRAAGRPALATRRERLGSLGGVAVV